jgi:hypothetical protein
MEFQPETYNVFEADQFERARLTGGAVMEVMLQMRPNGRCLDHYRIALDGTVLETQVVATSVFRAPVLAKYRLTYQAWPRDLKIRRNMTTTAWVDSFHAISARNILVSTDDKGDAVPPEEIKNVFASIKEMSMKSTSTRYAQTDVCGWNIRPCLGQLRPGRRSRPSLGKCFASVIVSYSKLR